MMRPMFVEFPEDRGCDTLDKQYMMGDSLLIAPVFKESGEVDYYLPAGKWYNLLTGQFIEGGGWQKEHHDFFTMPILVRPNSILAMGGCDDRPDYDYSNGVTLYLSVFEDGAKGSTSVTDLDGNIVMTAKAAREGDAIFLHVEGGNGNWSYETLGDKNGLVVIESSNTKS